jgi:hypothetical protein
MAWPPAVKKQRITEGEEWRRKVRAVVSGFTLDFDAQSDPF